MEGLECAVKCKEHSEGDFQGISWVCVKTNGALKVPAHAAMMSVLIGLVLVGPIKFEELIAGLGLGQV